jgi:hypothetical protein
MKKEERRKKWISKERVDHQDYWDLVINHLQL